MKIASKFFALLVTGLFFAGCQQEEIIPSESHYNHYPTAVEDKAPTPLERTTPENVLKAKP